MAFNAAVPAVGQVAQQVGLYQMQVFLRHQRLTLEEGALPVGDGHASPEGEGSDRWPVDGRQN